MIDQKIIIDEEKTHMRKIGDVGYQLNVFGIMDKGQPIQILVNETPYRAYGDINGEIYQSLLLSENMSSPVSIQLNHEISNTKSKIIQIFLPDNNEISYNMDVGKQKEFVMKQIGSDSSKFQKLTNHFRYDRDIVSYVIQLDPQMFVHTSQEIRSDEEFVKKFLEYDPRILKYISEELMANKEFISACFDQYGHKIMTYLSEESRNWLLDSFDAIQKEYGDSWILKKEIIDIQNISKLINMSIVSTQKSSKTISQVFNEYSKLKRRSRFIRFLLALKINKLKKRRCSERVWNNSKYQEVVKRSYKYIPNYAYKYYIPKTGEEKNTNELVDRVNQTFVREDDSGSENDYAGIIQEYKNIDNALNECIEKKEEIHKQLKKIEGKS